MMMMMMVLLAEEAAGPGNMSHSGASGDETFTPASDTQGLLSDK